MASPSLRSGRADEKYSSMSVDEKLLLQLFEGSNQAVKQLLDDGALVDGSPGLPYRPLIVAARFGRLESAKLLVQRGASLDVSQSNDMWKDEDDPAASTIVRAGSRALHAAAFGGADETVRALLELGADPHAVDNYVRQDCFGGGLQVH